MDVSVVCTPHFKSMIATSEHVVYDARSGLHKAKIRPPWKLQPELHLKNKPTSSVHLDKDVDYLEKEFQSKNQAGDMNEPVVVVSDPVAPMEILKGGTYQAGIAMVQKNAQLRTREGLEAISEMHVRSVENATQGPIILSGSVVS